MQDLATVSQICVAEREETHLDRLVLAAGDQEARVVDQEVVHPVAVRVDASFVAETT